MCLQDHPVSQVIANPTEFYCDYCYSSITERAYTCGQCDYHVCQPCNLKYYRRKNLVQQTSNHSFYDHYILDAVTEEANDDPS